MKIQQTIVCFLFCLLVGACASKNEAYKRQKISPERIDRLYANFIARWDYNEDGNATCDDIAVQRSRLFKRLDEDKNGELTTREYRHARFEDKSFMFYEIDRIDENASLTVDLDEFIAVNHSIFHNMDKDGNCTINRREAILAMRERNPEAACGKKGKGKKRRPAPT